MSESIYKDRPGSSEDKASINQLNIDNLLVNESSKLDVRNRVEYTFKTTSTELIEHKLGKVPFGYSIVSQTQAAIISGNPNEWTSKRLKLSSSVANNAVRLLIF